MDFEVLSTKENIFEEIKDKFVLNLPSDYKKFISDYNGIVIENGILRIQDLEEEVMMNVLYSFDTTLNRTLTIAYWNREYKDDIPENSLLIGDFQDGGFLLLICGGEDKGLYYYDHAYTFEQSNDNCNTYFITDTFENFIKMLE